MPEKEEAKWYVVHPYSGYQQIPWSLIGDGINDLKLQLLASMPAAWDEVFNKVTGCGLDQLKKIE